MIPGKDYALFREKVLRAAQDAQDVKKLYMFGRVRLIIRFLSVWDWPANMIVQEISRLPYFVRFTRDSTSTGVHYGVTLHGKPTRHIGWFLRGAVKRHIQAENERFYKLNEWRTLINF